MKAALCGVVAATLTFAALAGAQQPSPTAMTCVNPASGTTWQIRIDYSRHTVDGYPATIDESKIVWHDVKDNGNYTLDRKIGKLTFVAPSSTGGYFLYDRCTPAKAE